MTRSRPIHRSVALFFFAMFVTPPLSAQDLPADRPVPLPAESPTKAEHDRAEAVTLYGLGTLNERKNRLLEAIRCYEGACKLDSDAVAPRRALVPLYLAIDRFDDALTTARRVLELDPGDWETGSLYVRQLRAQGKLKEALASLQKTITSPRLKEKPDSYAQMWADIASLQEETGEWEGAAASLHELAQLLDHPEALLEQGSLTKEDIVNRAAETYEQLGGVWLKAGRLDKAVAAFETARSRDPSRSTRLALHLAEVHDRTGRPREALARLDEYLTSRPSGMEGYEMMIRLRTQLGESAQIVPVLQAAASADQHNTALAILLARELRRAARPEEAEAIYKRLADDVPGPDVYRGLFGLYKEQGMAGGDQALRLLNDTIRNANSDKKDPVVPGSLNSNKAENEAAKGRAMLVALREDAGLVRLLVGACLRGLENRVKIEGSTRMLLAVLAERTRQFEAAEELYRSCLEHNEATPHGSQTQIYYGLLNVLQQAHKYKKVIAVCEQGLIEARETNRVIFYRYLSTAHMMLGHINEALAAADKAVDVANPEARLICQRLRVEVLSQAGKHAEAIAACRAMLSEYNQSQKKDEPQSQEKQDAIREIRLSLSDAYNLAHEPEKSEEQLQLILKTDPDDVTANNNLGYQWAERGKNLAEAERMIRKAIDLDHHQRMSGTSLGLDSDRENAAYVDSLGWILFRRGDLKGARAELEKATTLPFGDDDPVVWDHFGDVLFRQGEKVKAAEAWRKAVTLFEAGYRPKDDRYGEIQQKLKQTAP